MGSTALGLALLLGLAAGSRWISPAELLGSPDLQTRTILLDIRLPRLLLAAGVGACLGLAGTALQALLRNPLADPYVVGASSGAALGASLTLTFGLGGPWTTPALALLGSLGAMAFVVRLSRIGGVLPVDTLLLAGVVVGSFLWSAVTFLMTLAGQDLQRILFFLTGNLADAGWEQLAWLLPAGLVGLALLVSQALNLNLLTLGEEAAIPLGLDAEGVKLRILVASSLLTAGAVSVSGIIGFLGLVVPHLTRRLVGPDHRLLLPAAALGGAVFLALCDTLARCLIPSRELPVGIVTALLGAPFFFHLLHRRRRG